MVVKWKEKLLLDGNIYIIYYLRRVNEMTGNVRG